MHLSEIINVNRIRNNVDVKSKKRALEELSLILSEDQNQLDSSEIFESLISRERLGATGLGYGIAIPHGRIKGCTTITGAFIKIHEGIDFNTSDNVAVDMLFALIVPEESTDEHLQVLALLAGMFRDETLRTKIQASQDDSEIHQLMIDWKKPD
ncbi:MAG: PTS IIA-like nitrogen regulatory protein PtsN [Woeseiaceae bacterium]